jgi:hypothetical protein
VVTAICLRMIERSFTGLSNLKFFLFPFLFFAFLFSICLFTGGASSLEWVQPAVERGGFHLCYMFCFVLFLFIGLISSF